MLKLWIFFCSALGWAKPWGSLLSSSGYTGGWWQASELCHHSNKGEGKATWVMSTYLHCGKHKTSSPRASPVLHSTGVVLHLQPKEEKRSPVFHSWGNKSLSAKPLTSVQTLPVSQLKGSSTDENSVPWRPIPITCSYLLWGERCCMAIAVCHAAPKASPLKTGLALAQCHKLSCPHSTWVAHRALEDLLCCLCPKEVNTHNLHLNIKYWSIALMECRAYVTGMRGDGILPEWGFSICSNSPYRPEGLE